MVVAADVPSIAGPCAVVALAAIGITRFVAPAFAIATCGVDSRGIRMHADRSTINAEFAWSRRVIHAVLAQHSCTLQRALVQRCNAAACRSSKQPAGRQRGRRRVLGACCVPTAYPHGILYSVRAAL